MNTPDPVIEPLIAPPELCPHGPTRDEFMNKLRLLGIDRVVISFSGSGDSGQVDDVAFEDRAGNRVLHQGKCVGDIMIATWQSKDVFDKGTWKKVEGVGQAPLHAVVERMFEEADNFAGLDWANNDGGQGTFVIRLNPDVAEGETEIGMHIGTNYTQTDEHEFNF